MKDQVINAITSATQNIEFVLLRKNVKIGGDNIINTNKLIISAIL